MILKTSDCIQDTTELLLHTIVTALDEHGAVYATSVQHSIVTLFMRMVMCTIILYNLAREYGNYGDYK